jgi:glycosyltransferase involved in cell wall biosynthesis
MSEASKRIFWDGYGLDNPYSGVCVAAKGLLTALLEAGGPRPTMIGTDAAKRCFPELDHIVLSAAPKPAWPLIAGRAAAKASPEPHVIHGLSNFNVPYLRGEVLGLPYNQRRVLTVHDLIPFLAPNMVSPLLVAQLQLVMGRAVQTSDKIVCVSQWTKGTLVERYPRVQDRIVVIPNGVPEGTHFGPKAPDESGQLRLLTVARYEPYKRLDQVVRVLRALEGKAVGTIATNPDGESWLAKEAPDLLASQRLTVHARVTGEAITALYRTADVLLHPSLYEGYCLPAVEAMAQGCAVVYQSGSAVDEIVSDAVGIAMDRGASTDDWVQAVLAAGARLRQSGWAATAAAHYATLPRWKDAAHALQSLYNGLP